MSQGSQAGVLHALRQRGREWLSIAAICLSLGLAYALAAKLRGGFSGQRVDWGTLPAREAIHFGSWALLYPLVALMAIRFPMGERRPRHLLAHIAGAALFSPLLMTVTVLLQATLLGGRDLGWRAFVMRVIVAEYAWGMTAYLVLLSVAHAAEYSRRHRERALQAARLEAALALARLRALRMQLEPHFLFNALNSVSSLVHKDPDGAQRMLARLGDCLRLTLDDSMPQKVELRQELEFLERYLDIERVRFRDRLTVVVDAPSQLLDARVPYLILQPLVENAIRHGIAKHAGPGRVEVRVAHGENRLRLEVEDNGRASRSSPELLKPGVGLSNIRARLHQLYGADAALAIEPGDGTRGLRVSIVLPLERGTFEDARAEETA